MAGPNPAWTDTRVEYGALPTFWSTGGATNIASSYLVSFAGNARAWRLNVRATYDSEGQLLRPAEGLTNGNELIEVGSSNHGGTFRPGISIDEVTLLVYSDTSRNTLIQTIPITTQPGLPTSPPDIQFANPTLTTLGVNWLPRTRIASASGATTRSANASDLAVQGSQRVNAVYNRATKRYEATLTGLTSGTSYSVSAGGGSASGQTASPIVYPAPTARITAATATSATLTFETPTGGSTPTLQVQLGGQWRTVSNPFTIGAADQTWNPALTAAADGAAFSFQARWVNANGPTNGTAGAISGRAQATDPAAPVNFNAVGSATSLRLGWNAPGIGAAAPTSYEYVVRRAQVTDTSTLAAASDKVTITAPATSATITSDIIAYTRYWAYLRAVRGTTATAWVESSATTTPVPAANTTHLTLTWDVIRGYTYELRSDTDPAWRAATSPYVLAGLPPNETINISVRALYEGNAGSAADIAQLTYPAQPSVIVISKVPPVVLFEADSETRRAATLTYRYRAGSDVAPLKLDPPQQDGSGTATLDDGGRFEVAGLTGTEYAFLFTASNATGSGTAQELTFSPTAPSPAFEYWGATTARISATIASPAADATYQMRISPENGAAGAWTPCTSISFDDADGDSVTGTGVQFTGLSAGSRYLVEARSLNAQSEPSEYAELGVATRPAAPSNFAITASVPLSQQNPIWAGDDRQWPILSWTPATGVDHQWRAYTTSPPAAATPPADLRGPISTPHEITSSRYTRGGSVSLVWTFQLFARLRARWRGSASGTTALYLHSAAAAATWSTVS